MRKGATLLERLKYDLRHSLSSRRWIASTYGQLGLVNPA